jgi:septum formation protein
MMGNVMGNKIITPSVPIILASASTIRHKIFKKTGIEFSVIISNINENELKNKLVNMSIKDVAVTLASEKAYDVSKNNPNSYVIGADQICNLDEKVFSKPNNMSNAIKQLQELSGKTHKQTSGICLYYNGRKIWSDTEEAELTMYKLREKEIIKYLEIDKPFNSCGSYKYESFGMHLFSKVIGSNETIQGLPLTGLLEQMRKENIYSIENIKDNS